MVMVKTSWWWQVPVTTSSTVYIFDARESLAIKNKIINNTIWLTGITSSQYFRRRRMKKRSLSMRTISISTSQAASFILKKSPSRPSPSKVLILLIEGGEKLRV